MYEDIGLFDAALGIQSPWFIQKIEFDADGKRLDVHINFKRGSAFPSKREGVSGFVQSQGHKAKNMEAFEFFPTRMLSALPNAEARSRRRQNGNGFRRPGTE